MTAMHRGAVSLLVIAGALGCGPKNGGQTQGQAYGSQPQVETRVIEERMPDGSIKRTTVTTTRRQVEAPPPPPRPADPYPADPIVKYNVDRVNQYRASVGQPPLLYDAAISAFARQGSERLARDHVAHANFAEHAKGAPGFGSRSAENQGDPNGVPALDPNPQRNTMRQVDVMLELMWREGPGGGHYDNMVNPKMRRIGIGIVYVQGRMYMTNDLSD